MPFVKGDPNINRKGRPEGVISVKKRLKKIFEDNPQEFEDYLMRYIKNPANEKHIAEMLDGKPHQNIDSHVKIELPKPLLYNVRDHNSDQEAIEAPKED